MATPSRLNLQNGIKQTIFHTPKWGGPKHIKLLVTTKLGGQSESPFTSWNLAEHVNDHSEKVALNRELLCQQIGKPSFFLNQVHSNKVVTLASPLLGVLQTPSVDGVISMMDSHFLAILTADCLPILLCDANGDVVAACHAGWRGLANGVIDNTIQAMIEQIKPHSAQQFRNGLHAYIGPAISQENFEVGAEVKEYFMQNHCLSAQAINTLFKPSEITGKYYADLFGLATQTLNQLGVDHIYTDKHCTYNNNEYFYSYRRDKITGRFASCIWFE